MAGRRIGDFTRDGLVFDVRDAGPVDGTPVVLLHGFPQSSRTWDAVSPLLHARGYRTIAPDQRGYSPRARPGPRRAYRQSELIADVVGLVDAVGVGPVHLVGHDWGGVVAWGVAAERPGLLRSLTALSVPHPAAMAKAMVTSDQALRSYYMALFQLPLLPERLLLSGGGNPLRRSLRGGGLSQEAAAHYVSRMREPGALSAALGWYRALPWSTRDPVGTVRVPTLHVWSTGDAFLGRVSIEATRQYVDAPYRLEVLEDVTHWIPELAPDRVAELVTAHVRTA
jgi:pimeloyl-ACP methyl ester carboxylesterase